MIFGWAAREDGWALVIALMVLLCMMIVGLSAVAMVDTQGHQSRHERVRESSFNLAEGVLNNQAFVLSRNWRGATGADLPACSSATAPAATCPDRAWLAGQFSSTDYAAGSGWTVQVMDNGGTSQSYYEEGVTNAAGVPARDANNDKRVWVRSQAVVRGKRRTVVAQVRMQRNSEAFAFPRNVITAGRLRTSNQGYKVIIDTKGRSAAAAPVKVRCTPGPQDPGCLDYEQSKNQISPDTAQGGYNDGGRAVAQEVIDRFRVRAQIDGTYYASGCPSSPAGAVVFVEDANCSYAHVAACCNSESSPGVFIVNRGTLSLTGNNTFYGMIYAGNTQGSTGAVIDLDGDTTIQGAIVVEGSGGVVAGSNQLNVIWDDRFLFQDSTLFTYGTAGVVQNTWREIRA